MKFHCCVLPTEVSSVHVAPKSVEVQMLPNETLAASLLPCLDEVMELHCLLLPGDAVFSVHVAPEFVEVQMFPPAFPDTTAASLIPSNEEVMELQRFGKLIDVAALSVHVRACTGPHAHNKRNMVNRRRNVRDPRRQRATRFIFSGVPLRSRGVRFELSPKRALARGPSRVRVSCGLTTN